MTSLSIGNKPRYVSPQPSTFMKSLEVELSEKRIKDAKDAKERADNMVETPEEPGDDA